MPSRTGLIIQYKAFETGDLKQEPAGDIGLIIRLICEGRRTLIIRNAKLYIPRLPGERESTDRCYL